MKKKIKTIEYNPAHETHGYSVRWVENVSCGLRLVGFADEIARINHRGWFTDDDMQDETYRGIVYRLPSRDSKEQYVYGYADPDNDGCALLCFDVETDKLEAARQADRFAETFAEYARDYNRAWQAGQRYRELDDEIKDMRKEALAIGEEMRAARVAKVQAPTICATLRGKVMDLYLRIQHSRKKRRELMSDFGRCEGFTE